MTWKCSLREFWLHCLTNIHCKSRRDETLLLSWLQVNFYLTKVFKSLLPWASALLMAVLIMFSMSFGKISTFGAFLSYGLYRACAHFKQLLLLTCVFWLPEQLNAVNIGSILCQTSVWFQILVFFFPFPLWYIFWVHLHLSPEQINGTKIMGLGHGDFMSDSNFLIHSS